MYYKSMVLLSALKYDSHSIKIIHFITLCIYNIFINTRVIIILLLLYNII